MRIQLPAEFLAILGKSLPAPEVEKLLQGLDMEVPTSVRINAAKHTQIKPELIAGKVVYSEDVVLLKNRPLFVGDPAFHAGAYYVQEASSSIVGSIAAKLIATFDEPILALDLCAAPGGKSTHLASVLREGDILVANEVIHSRTPILHENLCKWGHSNHMITRADSKQLGNSGVLFDLIAADMPCSGEGLFRKDPHAINEWSVNNVAICADRQMRIAADIWPALAERGYLIYSTCTYNRKENEENVQWIVNELGAEVVELNLPQNWNLLELEKGMHRMLPGRTPGEGFFFAVLKKTGKAREKEPKNLQKIKFTQDYDGFFNNRMQVFEWNQEWYFLRHAGTEKIKKLITSLPSLYSAGTPMGRAFEKKFKPDTALALSIYYNPNAFAETELSNSEIIAYLRRESLPNPHKIAGIHSIKWNGFYCGFANGVKQSSNNLWPMEWRIRKEGVLAETIVFI